MLVMSFYLSLPTFVNNIVPTVDGYSKHLNCPAVVVSSNVGSWRLPLYQGVSNRICNRSFAGELQMVLVPLLRKGMTNRKRRIVTSLFSTTVSPFVGACSKDETPLTEDNKMSDQ
jgi:hypothetical protein